MLLRDLPGETKGPITSPTQLAAKVLVRAGIAMVILCLLCRWALPDGADTTVDTLAVIASLLVVLTGILGQRVSVRREARLDRPDRPGRSPR